MSSAYHVRFVFTVPAMRMPLIRLSVTVLSPISIWAFASAETAMPQFRIVLFLTVAVRFVTVRASSDLRARQAAACAAISRISSRISATSVRSVA